VTATQKLLRFGTFELNLDTEELRRSGTLIHLAPQPFRLLAMLTNHAGQIVTREEIKEKLWGEETYVDFEQGMNHCIKQIRNVLGDNADHPLYVETLPRRGYRFLAPVVSKNVPAPAPKIIKSASGIQSAILPALAPQGTQVTPKPPEAPPRVEVPVRGGEVTPDGITARQAQPAVADREAPTPPAPPGVAGDTIAPQQKVTSATAAAEALAPEIARLRKGENRVRQALAWMVVALALLAVVVLYWRLHHP